MKINVFSVYDAKSGVYGPPFAARCESEVITSFAEAVRAGTNKVWQMFPEDFALVRLGTYDDESGALESCEIGLLATASKFVPSGDNNVKKDL